MRRAHAVPRRTRARAAPRHTGGALALAAAMMLAVAAQAQPVRLPGPLPAGARLPWYPAPPRLAVPAPLVDLAARLPLARSAAESLAAWQTVRHDSLLGPYALRRIARLRAALGDTARADVAWAALAATRSPWQWEAGRARAELAFARGEAAHADSLLERAQRDAWSDAERGDAVARRSDFRLAMGDSAGAAHWAVRMIALHPGHGRASETLRRLEALRAARGEPLSASEQVDAAGVDQLRGRRAEAAARLARIGGADAERELRRARLLREANRFRDARAAAAAAMRAARHREDSVEVMLERARILRDAGDTAGALAAYARVGRAGPRRLGEAQWERGRLYEERGEWRAARGAYARVPAQAGRAEQAMFRAGLMSVILGDAAAARAWFARGDTENFRFWHGVVLRRTGHRGGDSLLRTLADAPGFTFYRSAARDTLGLRGWPGGRARQPHPPHEPGVVLARTLDGLGCHDDAGAVLDRWAAGDRRLAPPRAVGPGPPTSPRAYPPSADAWLEASAASYRAGRIRQGIRFAERAIGRLRQAPEPLDWSPSPWLYPPAYDALFAAWPETAPAGGLERALLQALTWKESRFDPVARSRSDAIGLIQLKRAAVIDVARWLREPTPSDAALADPALNLRYGARYLERMLERFDGDLPLALAAYNAGPTAARRWARLRAAGGDALACEEIDYPETQDYVKTILAVRQAYRELRPTFSP